MKKPTTLPRPSRNCMHHWIIATPNGAISAGHCKRCGQERQFSNALDDKVWTTDGFSLSGSPSPARNP